MSLIAAIRPDDWNYVLLLHIGGAMILVGGMLTAASALSFALVIALVLGGIGVRRLRSGKGTGLLKATMVISILLLASFVVAVWAMSGKPG